MRKIYFHSRKRFGQHFLIDENIIENIVVLLMLKKTDCLVEIGPGLGALTQQILPLVKKLDVIELDRDLIPQLEANCAGLGRLKVHQADALQFDFTTLARRKKLLRLIGNLPYNISTPLIFHLLEQASVIQDMHFMLQKEVVERMAAQPGNKIYGRLSVMVQYHCRVELLLRIRPDAFSPPPKVDSAVVRLEPYQKIPFPVKNYALFSEIVREAFNHRRKVLRNCLKNLVTAEQWKIINIDPGLRPEQLSVEDYVKIANHRDEPYY